MNFEKEFLFSILYMGISCKIINYSQYLRNSSSSVSSSSKDWFTFISSKKALISKSFSFSKIVFILYVCNQQMSAINYSSLLSKSCCDENIICNVHCPKAIKILGFFVHLQDNFCLQISLFTHSPLGNKSSGTVNKNILETLSMFEYLSN